MDTMKADKSRVAREVTLKLVATSQREGMGAVVRRSIGTPQLRYFDPFLMLDEFSVTAPAGFLDHPHRGFETVTYMLQGSMSHEDFEGHRGTISAGDVQWMTAGRGIVHSEMPASPNGTQKGLQLWINLSSSNKLMEPNYQEMKREEMAEASRDGVEVRVIAGDAMGAKSPVYTRTPTMYLDFTLHPGSRLWQPVPAKWNAFVYVLDGEVGILGVAYPPHCLLLLGPGDGLEAVNMSVRPARFLLIAGEPLHEPVVQLGPFVMNTQEQINQTLDDYDAFTNGFENARGWRSHAAAEFGS